jgi:hypothetical protein
MLMQTFLPVQDNDTNYLWCDLTASNDDLLLKMVNTVQFYNMSVVQNLWYTQRHRWKDNINNSIKFQQFASEYWNRNYFEKKKNC